MRVVREIVLPISAAAAWRVLLDWERQADWMPDADEVLVSSDQRDGVGTTVEVKTRVLNVPLFTERLEVVGWDPPHELRMAHRTFIRGVGTWSLEVAGAGARFRWTEDISLPVPLLGGLALALYRPFMSHLMARAMRDLRAGLGTPTPAAGRKPR